VKLAGVKSPSIPLYKRGRFWEDAPLPEGEPERIAFVIRAGSGRKLLFLQKKMADPFMGL
jgi:hypothetical protein